EILKAARKNGTDPLQERKEAERQAEITAARGQDTVAAVVDLFVKRHLEAKHQGQRRKGQEAHGTGRAIAATWTPAATRTLFNLALRRGSPKARRLPQSSRASGRGDEPRPHTDSGGNPWIWSAADGLSYPFGSFFKLALITGQRRDEVA